MIIKTIANIIATNLINLSAKTSRSISELISKEDLIYLATLFQEGQINNQGLSQAIDYLSSNPNSKAEEAVKKLDLIQVSDEGQLLAFVKEAISKNAAQVEQYRSGKVQVIGYLVGQCMTLSQKKGNPAKFKTLLEQELQA